ncbi:hypothetical protein B0A81_15320 [Flavobacterium plurextorum]|uniref:Acyltransferase n=1 Tax=Flavobacterium plurextorum TaxID=1114867 RepID=A0ABX4CRW3_9FLAO|nr:acyltransferase [Flavobacterium plurextorum]OXB05318.1 hypothetical protein B0A81_15320 [Flavobacterium plurextorum]
MIKLIFRVLKTINAVFFHYYGQIFCFFLPNLISILCKRVVFKSKISVQQIIVCRGVGRVEIGENCSFGYILGGFHKGGSIELQARYQDSIIKIGNNVSTNNNIMMCSANYIEIGEKTLIGQYVTIMDHEAHNTDPARRQEIGEIGKIIIGKNAWLGNNVTILKNSEIGDNTIVANGAVVSGKFPANVIIGGIPARIIKSL